MKTAELRALSVAELLDKSKELLRARFKASMELATQSSTKVHKPKELRRLIARINTIITEKKIVTLAGEEK